MNNKVQVFQNEQFGQVRTIEENGKVLFCAKDVAIFLDIKTQLMQSNSIARGW